jgi:gliding motility-associated-like protein
MLDSVSWDFGDPASGAANFSTNLHPSHAFSSHGRFFVQWTAWQWGVPITWSDTITVLPTPSLSLPTDSFICPDDSLFVDVSQGFPASYLWSTGSTDSTLYISEPGTYWVTVSTDSCGSVSDTLILDTYTPPDISLQDTVACEEDIIVFSVFADRASYLWNTGETSPSIYAEDQGIYSVTATNPCGESSAQARLERQPCDCRLYIPDAFTPNGDGNNDVFTLVSNCTDMQWEMMVYNRWGQQVAVLSHQQPEWNGLINGQPAPTGVYTYTLRYHFPESQPIGISFEKVHYGQMMVVR